MSLLCQLRGLRLNDTQVAMTIPIAHISVSNCTLYKRQHRSLEKLLLLALRQKIYIYKMSLEHCIMPESNEVFSKYKTKLNPTVLKVCQRNIEISWKNTKWSDLEQFEKQNKVVFGLLVKIHNKYPWVHSDINGRDEIFCAEEFQVTYVNTLPLRRWWSRFPIS